MIIATVVIVAIVPVIGISKPERHYWRLNHDSRCIIVRPVIRICRCRVRRLRIDGACINRDMWRPNRDMRQRQRRQWQMEMNSGLRDRNGSK